MRILIASPFCLPESGGIQVLVDHVARGLADTFGHDVRVVTRTLPGRPEEDAINGVRITRMDPLGRQRPLRGLARLAQVMASYRPDVVLCVEPSPRWVVSLLVAVFLQRIRMVLVVAGTRSEIAPLPWRWLAGLGAIRVVGISRYALGAYRFWSGRWAVAYIGGDVGCGSSSLSYAERSPMVLTVARVDPRKNLEMVVRVARLLPDYRFVVVGDTTVFPEYAQLLRALVEELGAENIVFAGRVSEERKRELYREARAFFLPTHHEMFGIVFVEAMAAGLPIVASRVAAVPEVVTEDVGCLLSPSATPEEYADKLRWLLSDREAWERLSGNGPPRAAEFSWQRTVREYDRILADVVSR